tara:strand:+ start:3919 stop:5337 length:1419 start_codon:yes stop_codon:yes gene_type:complete
MAITGATNTVPAARAQTLASNYIDFATAGSSDGWAQQYLPDLMEKEAEVFGNRTISGFLSQVGAEESMASDQVVWSEQGRLHISYKNCTVSSETITIVDEVDGQTSASTHAIRPGDMVLLADANVTATAFVISTAADTITVKPYTAANLAGAGISSTCSVLVYGSEYVKGAVGRDATNSPGFLSFTNKPIILKDKYEISGSDASQIGWVEVSGEDGQSGYLWYLKASGDTKARFADYLEMAMIESEKATGTAPAATQTGAAGSVTGTEGLFAAITSRGNQTSGVTGVNAATDLAEFDAILAELDKNGAIEENMMFVNRGTALAIDDMLASMNSYGAGGTSYGVFDNEEDMALNLGFSGFRRGSYDFYKSDWKYLNDKSTRGIINDTNTVGAVRGVMIPAGVSSVYDQNLGKNLKRPFLHVRYRASNTESRKMKTWTTGSVGATTSDLDAMEMHFLSERCLVVQGANNFMLMN